MSNRRFGSVHIERFALRNHLRFLYETLAEKNLARFCRYRIYLMNYICLFTILFFSIPSYGRNLYKNDKILDGLLKINVKNIHADTIYFYNSHDETDLFMKIYIKKHIKYKYAYYFFSPIHGEKSMHVVKEYFPNIAPIMETFEQRQETLIFRSKTKGKDYLGFAFSTNETKYISNRSKFYTYFSFNESFEKFVIQPKEDHKIWIDTLMTKELQILEPMTQDYLVLKVLNDWLNIEIIPIEYYLSDKKVDEDNYPIGWFKWKSGEDINIRFYESIF